MPDIIPILGPPGEGPGDMIGPSLASSRVSGRPSVVFARVVDGLMGEMGRVLRSSLRLAFCLVVAPFLSSSSPGWLFPRTSLFLTAAWLGWWIDRVLLVLLVYPFFPISGRPLFHSDHISSPPFHRPSPIAHHLVPFPLSSRVRVP